MATEKYNHLTILSRMQIPVSLQKKYKAWHVTSYAECKCDCGNVVELPYTAVVNGFIKSCGCGKRKSSIDNMKKVNEERIKNSKKIRYLGLDWTVKDFSNKFGMSVNTIYRCLKAGMSPEEISRRGRG